MLQETPIQIALETTSAEALETTANNLEPENIDSYINAHSQTGLSTDPSVTMPMLSEGFLAHWLPLITQAERELEEFEKKQQLLLDDVKNTSNRVENQDNYEYVALTIPEYTNKLQYIRSTILMMLSRSKLLKRRVGQLKSIKDQQIAQVAQIKQRERKFDETVLAAKVVANPEMQTIVLKSSRKKKKETDIKQKDKKGGSSKTGKEKGKKKAETNPHSSVSTIREDDNEGNINTQDVKELPE
ncbi:374_t:CDS:2 [Ambispora gerdemannii]|uniref:374_t:CDS:1 n=1 Tax=Ambispora gerdemannii TaxID=144530 RepID=A0A9N8YZ29_9GLOM|nr:374_t:CDS:2 [Ambispora gerdemannii]